MKLKSKIENRMEELRVRLFHYLTIAKSLQNASNTQLWEKKIWSAPSNENLGHATSWMTLTRLFGNFIFAFCSQYLTLFCVNSSSFLVITSIESILLPIINVSIMLSTRIHWLEVYNTVCVTRNVLRVTC